MKQKLASLCIKSGYQPSLTLRVIRNVNIIKGPPQSLINKEDIKCEEALERIEKELGIHRTWGELLLDCWSAPAQVDLGSSSPAATLLTSHSDSSQAHSEHAARNLERRLCSKLLCCEHLRMSIKLMSFKRPISIAEKEKKIAKLLGT